MPVTICRLLAVLAFVAWALPAHAVPQTADQDNCELCHGLPMLARVDDGGSLRNFEVAYDLFTHSEHRTVPCRDCHEDINQFPHELPVQEVNCGKTCHVSRPFELTVFSHKDEVDAHNLGVHGFDPEQTEAENALKPSCKYCHANRHYAKPTELVEQQAQHCAHCHESGSLLNVVEHVDRHMSHRSAESSLDIVQICSSCHADNSLMNSFGVNETQVSGFEHHFHGKALKRGLNQVAHCADCHSNHMILTADDPASTLSTSNIRNTCGTIGCHVEPSLSFAKSAVHSEPTPDSNAIVFYVEWGFILLTGITMALLFTHILLDFGRWVYDRRRGGSSHE
jgi:hypothetical protein